MYIVYIIFSIWDPSRRARTNPSTSTCCVVGAGSKPLSKPTIHGTQLFCKKYLTKGPIVRYNGCMNKECLPFKRPFSFKNKIFQPHFCFSCGSYFENPWYGVKYCCICRITRYSKSGDIKSRCARYGCAYDPKVTLDSVFKRDQERCQISPCLYPDTPLTRTGEWKFRATIDHIIPLCGGPETPGHVWNNVRLAHLGCNSSKSGKDQEISIRLLPTQYSKTILPTEKICAECKFSFKPKRVNNIYCSRKCYRQGDNKRKRRASALKQKTPRCSWKKEDFKVLDTRTEKEHTKFPIMQYQYRNGKRHDYYRNYRYRKYLLIQCPHQTKWFRVENGFQKYLKNNT